MHQDLLLLVYYFDCNVMCGGINGSLIVITMLQYFICCYFVCFRLLCKKGQLCVAQRLQLQ